jgi:hypothetical protein
MGSRLLGIPRRRTRQVARVVVEEFPGSYLLWRPYLRLQESNNKGLPILVDRVLSHDKDGEEEVEDEERRRRRRNVSSSSSNNNSRIKDGRITPLGTRLLPFAALGGEAGIPAESFVYLARGFQERRWMATYSRIKEEAARVGNAATAVAYDEDEDEKMKKTKEKEKDVSPEDCDEAVEGLSSAKAKARQAQEPSKKSDGWLIKIRNVFFGIGPALRAIAAMSRWAFLHSLFDFEVYCHLLICLMKFTVIL